MTNLAEKGQYRVGFIPEPGGAPPTPRLTTLETMPFTVGVSDLVPRRKSSDGLGAVAHVGRRRIGNASGATSNSMERATPG